MGKPRGLPVAARPILGGALVTGATQLGATPLLTKLIAIALPGQPTIHFLKKPILQDEAIIEAMDCVDGGLWQ